MPKWIWGTWCHQNPGNRVNFKDQYLTHIIYLQGQGHFYTFNKIQKSHSGTAKITLWMPCQSEYGPPGATKTPETGSISKSQYLTHSIYLQGQGHFYTFYKIQKSHSGTAKMALWMPCQSEHGPPGATKTPGTGSISKINTWHTLYTYKVKVTSILFIKFKKVSLARLKWHFECHAKVNMGNLVPRKPRKLGQFQRLVPDTHYIPTRSRWLI